MGKKQITPKLMKDALLWIQTQRHSEVGTLFNDTGDTTHVYYSNFHETMRVNLNHEWARWFFSVVKPNTRPHDDRMFKLTPNGKIVLKATGVEWDRKAHP